MALDLKEAIEILEGGDWLSLRVVTANIAKGTGGKVLEIPKCRIARNHTQHIRQAPATVLPQREAKNPNHNLNFTRNIELSNKRIITIHPILITHIKNKKVL